MARLIIGAVALSVVLAGCGGDPKADPAPSPTGVETTKPVSTTPTPPAMPAAAKANTKAGAIAFVRHYIEVFNYAQKTGSDAELSALSSGRCKECNAVIRALQRIYRARGHIEGGALEAGVAVAEYNSAERIWLVLVQIESGPQSVSTGANAESEHLRGGHRSMDFSLERQGDGWKVAAWTRA